MRQLLSLLRSVPEFNDLLTALDSGRSPAALSGLSPTHRAFFAAAKTAQLPEVYYVEVRFTLR